MEETTSREKVLKKIRGALISKNENPYPSLDSESSVYHDLPDNNDVAFASEFTRVGGKFIYCENEADLKSNLASLVNEKGWKEVHCIDPELIPDIKGAGVQVNTDPESFGKMEAGITRCEFLIARFGSIMVSSRQTSGRRMNVFPAAHIVFAHTNQIVRDIKDAMRGMKERYPNNLPSMISMITGPSRTADIEKTLVMGAHGPEELYVFLLDNE